MMRISILTIFPIENLEKEDQRPCKVKHQNLMPPGRYLFMKALKEISSLRKKLQKKDL